MHEASAIYTIRSQYSSLSTKEKQIADFILENPKESVNPSIEELAERIGISESTMVRFAKKLGYSGYQRFRIALARETISAQQQLFESEVREGDDIADVVFKHACCEFYFAFELFFHPFVERFYCHTWSTLRAPEVNNYRKLFFFTYFHITIFFSQINHFRFASKIKYSYNLCCIIIS